MGEGRARDEREGRERMEVEVEFFLLSSFLCRRGRRGRRGRGRRRCWKSASSFPRPVSILQFTRSEQRDRHPAPPCPRSPRTELQPRERGLRSMTSTLCFHRPQMRRRQASSQLSAEQQRRRRRGEHEEYIAKKKMPAASTTTKPARQASRWKRA